MDITITAEWISGIVVVGWLINAALNHGYEAGQKANISPNPIGVGVSIRERGKEYEYTLVGKNGDFRTIYVEVTQFRVYVNGKDLELEKYNIKPPFIPHFQNQQLWINGNRIFINTL